MKLSEVELNKQFRILKIDSPDEVFETKCSQLGLAIGSIVSVKNRAPIFKDPLLIRVEDSHIVLTCEEASYLGVENVND